MRRFMLVLGGAVVAAAALAMASPANASPLTGSAGGGSCVSADQATYKHTFNGPSGTATITAVNPLCAGQSQDFSIASYTAPASTWTYPQFVYDVDHATIDAGHRSVTLKVDVPGCFTQVDTIFGDDVLNELTSNATMYGNAKVGSPAGIGSRSAGSAAWYNGGSGACTATPAVTFAGECDGAFSATVSNSAAADVDAVFVVDGRRIRVAPGKSVVVTGPDKGTLTIRDSSFTTNVGSWTQPSTGCATTPPAAPTTAAPTPSASTTSAAPATSAPTTAPTTQPAAPITALSPSTTPSAVPVVTNPATSSLPVTGSNVTSAVLIAFGFLLVGGGLVFFGRSVYRARHVA